MSRLVTVVARNVIFCLEINSSACKVIVKNTIFKVELV